MGYCTVDLVPVLLRSFDHVRLASCMIVPMQGMHGTYRTVQYRYVVESGLEWVLGNGDFDSGEHFFFRLSIRTS